MWVGMDAVDWAGLKHNYGSAQDVPGLLRRCGGPDPDDADDASSELLNLLFHQGGWVCSAASAALPFILRLAATPQVPSRYALLELVAMLAAEAGRIEARFLDPGWASAWKRALPELLRLLDDPEPEIRRAAADVVGACDSPGELVLPGLLRSWEAEDDPSTRLELVLALGQAALRAPAGVRAAEVFDLLHELLDAPQDQIRLAAVHALAPRDPGLPTRRLDLILEAVRDPSVELWRHTSSLQTGVLGVQHWTAGLITGPDPTFTLGLLADHHDDEQRIGALAQAGGLLSQWRSPAAELVPRLVARLADPAPEARFRAAELLACLGPATAAHADEVATLLSDTAARTTRKRETVGEAALWALARMNDPRCLPGLIELIAGTRSGFASASAHYPATDLHHVVLPALHELLGYLPDHAELLLPSICDQLDTATDDRLLNRICDVLADWGPVAKAAVPQLLGLLEDDRTWMAAAKALAGIGLAGNGARDLLLSRSRAAGPHTELAAWAYWRVGGEPGPALEELGRSVEERRFRHPALRKLAGLGSHAAPYADRLRALTADTDPWTRVEAAHALWAATSDTETAVPVLTTAVLDLTKGTYLPVMLPALDHLAKLGQAAQPAAYLLRDVPARDQRLRTNGGWRGFVQDENIRTAVRELLSASGPSA
ncbi:HEAT repeat domain-containing protein [Streptomyces atratus]|uniref:HEAT repeat domain-containing protein n=1 Tax=Streptomyces atratus TaxID=1893 RepID=UPI00225137AA|nr:HEAT repeat domain-containing protein [Streptomyces atratus]MCX5341944.1 HEAT repeat domain-containing protein [Streptomyces atratus]